MKSHRNCYQPGNMSYVNRAEAPCLIVYLSSDWSDTNPASQAGTSHPKPKSGLNSQFQGLKNKIYLVL